MNDLDELLRLDREAGVPEPPDASYTAAAVRRRMARAGAPGAGAPARGRSAHGTRPDLMVWLVVAASVGMLAGAAWAAHLAGISPGWFLLTPATGLAACPILLKKGAGIT